MWSWLFTASSIKFLTRRGLKSWWVYLAQYEDNSIQLLSIDKKYNGLPYLFSSVRLALFQKPDASEKWTSSTVTTKCMYRYWCDYCIKFRLFKGAQDFLREWWKHVACYYPTTCTEYSSTTTDMSVGTAVAVNINFCGYLPFLNISFVWIIWVQYATDNLSGQQKCLFHRPVLIFQPTVNSSGSNKQT